MRPRYYVLDGYTAVPTTDRLQWALCFEDIAARRVLETVLPDGSRLSTVFLGIDHQWGDGPPLLFETMYFTAQGQEAGCWRWTTWDAATAGHAWVLAALTS